MLTTKTEKNYDFLSQNALKCLMSMWLVLPNKTEKNSSRGLLRKTKFTTKKRDERVKRSYLLFFFVIYGLVIKAGDNYSFGSHFYSKCIDKNKR